MAESIVVLYPVAKLENNSGGQPNLSGIAPLLASIVNGDTPVLTGIPFTLSAITSGGSINVNSPKPAISAMTGSNSGRMDLKGILPTLSITDLVAPTGTIDVAALLPSLLEISHGATVKISLSLPLVSISGKTVTPPTTASVAAIYPVATLSVSDLPGTIGTVAANLYISTLNATGFSSTTAVVLLNALSSYLDAYTKNTPQDIGCLAVNLSGIKLTNYLNFAKFNSMVKFNDVYLAASLDGLYSLNGSTDNGSTIVSTIKTIATNFGVSNLKKIADCYLNTDSDGATKLSVINEDFISKDYLLPTNDGDLKSIKMNIGRGIKKQYWTFKITNSDGTKFNMESLEVHPQITSRKVS